MAEVAENVVEAKWVTLSKSVSGLRHVYRRKKDAANDFNGAVKLIADETGYSAKAIKAFIAAVENDKVDQYQEEAEQLQFMFEELPR